MEIQKSVRRVFICVFVAVVAVSCKTTEDNYRKAYDRAVAGRDNTTDIDSTIYGKVRREMSVSSVVLPTGDTLDVKVQHVRVTKDIGGATDESLKRYSVVAGQFKQRFNAASLRERLAGAGYPGAFVVETSEPYYYIVLMSSDKAEEAQAVLDGCRRNPPVPFREPLPFILRRPGR